MNKIKLIEDLTDEYIEACENPDADTGILHNVFWKITTLREQDMNSQRVNELAQSIRDDILRSLKGCDL